MNKTLLLFIIAAICFYFSLEANSKTIKVMVIDTGVDLSHEEISKHIKEPNNGNYESSHWHGTAMAGIVLKDTCDEIELISCNYHPYGNHEMEYSNACFTRALNEDISYINYSSSGSMSYKEERKILKKLSKKGTIIVVAAGNHHINLMKYDKCEGSYPACYLLKNMYIVQNLNKDGKLDVSSNYLKHPNVRSEIGVDVSCLMPEGKTGKVTGTSPAAAKYTNRLLLEECKKLHK